MPVRVLHLTTSSDFGGTERMTLELARRCGRSRCEMSVASLDGPGLLTEACEASGIEAWNLKAGRRFPWRFGRLLKWADEIDRRGIDIVHTYGLQADLVGRFLKGRLGAKRLVCGIRSVDLNRSRLRVWADRATSGKVDLFISNSEAGRQARIAREQIEPERIDVIHNGIELDPEGAASRQESRNSLGLADADAPVVAHVANLRWMKGHEQALLAARVVIERFPNAVFLFAGRDDSSGRFNDMARDLGLGGQARFLGFHPKPREVLRAADIAILPSLYEGCPVSMLEAMAEEKPIAASNAGGIPELARHEQEALLCPPGNAEELAEAIKRLANDPTLCSTLARNARRRAEEDFGLDGMVEKYLNRYEELLG